MSSIAVSGGVTEQSWRPKIKTSITKFRNVQRVGGARGSACWWLGRNNGVAMGEIEKKVGEER